MGEPWFGVKRYGLGLSPKSPAGWITTIVYLVLAVGGSNAVVALHGPPWLAVAVALALTAVFVGLVLGKSDGKPWRWRWGGRGE